MNILMINTTDAGGGAATIAQQIKAGMEARGHAVSFFAADIRGEDSDARIIPRSFLRKLFGFVIGSERHVSTDWIMGTKEFADADIIHCHNLHGRFFNLETMQKMSRIKPLVWTLHDEWAITPHCANTMQSSVMRGGLFACPSIDTPPRLLWDNSRHLARWKVSVYKKSKFAITIPSRWLMQRVERTVLGKQELHHIPNGVDTAVFTKTDIAAARAKFDLPLNKKIVLFLADDAVRNPWKGWAHTEALIDAYRGCDDVVFLSVGNRTPHQDGPNVLYRGYEADPANVALYYSAADVFLFTSLAENFPLSLLEAASCGLPVVTFDVGGASEIIIHKKNGYVARYRDQEDLASGLSWALAIERTERARSEEYSAQEIREKYTLGRMLDTYGELYASLISTP